MTKNKRPKNTVPLVIPSEQYAGWGFLAFGWSLGSGVVLALVLGLSGVLDDTGAGPLSLMVTVQVLVFSIPFVVAFTLLAWGAGVLALRTLRSGRGRPPSRPARASIFAACVAVGMMVPAGLLGLAGVESRLVVLPSLFVTAIAVGVALRFYLVRIEPRAREVSPAARMAPLERTSPS